MQWKRWVGWKDVIAQKWGKGVQESNLFSNSGSASALVKALKGTKHINERPWHEKSVKKGISNDVFFLQKRPNTELIAVKDYDDVKRRTVVVHCINA